MSPPPAPRVSDPGVTREFAAKRRRQVGVAVVFLPLALALGMVLLLGIGGSWRPWILVGGGAGLFAMLVLAKLDWSCPACGRHFGKGSFRARYCRWCGVALVDGEAGEGR